MAKYKFINSKSLLANFGSWIVCKKNVRPMQVTGLVIMAHLGGGFILNAC